MTLLRFGSATDVGMVRAQNEDNLLVEEPLFAVADGMGGHAAGEVASEAAIEALRVSFRGDRSIDGLTEAVKAANRRVWQLGQADADRRGMGTTLTAAALVDDGDDETLIIANVGDSRVYLLRDGDLSQVTEDHSLVEELVREGRLSPEEALVHPQKHVVTRVLGMGPEVDVDMFPVIPYRRDRLLLASDGLFNELTHDEIAAVLRRTSDPSETARELVTRAKQAGGADNITVVVVDVADDDARSETASAVLRDDATTAVPRLRRPDEDESAVRKTPPVAPIAPPPPPRTAPPVAHGSRITGRVVAFIVVLILLLAAAGGAVAYFARSTYYVSTRQQDVVIYRGRPGGLLWFKPTLQERTGHTVADVPASQIADLHAGHEESNLADARRYARNLFAQATAERAPASDPTGSPTTTTTTPSTVPTP